MYRKLATFLLAASAAMLLAGTAHAVPAPNVDFEVGLANPATASVAFNGTNLVVSGMNVTQFAGIGSPANAGVIQTVTGGSFGFTTGNVITNTATLLTFGAGPAGALTITGGVAALGLPAGSALLTGTITSAAIVANPINNSVKLTVAVFVNGINNAIADFYGFPRSSGAPGTGTAPWSGDVNFSFTLAQALNTPPWTVSGSGIGSGDLTTTPAPEPGTLALASIGVLGAVLYGRRRSSRKPS
jgi:hypothetical protein